MEMVQGQESCLVETNRRKVTVTIKITNDTPPGEFEMSSSDLDIKKLKYNGKNDHMLTFNNNQGGTYQDGFEVTFKLHPHGDYGFFIEDPADPDPNDCISVKKIDSSGHCPDFGDTWDGFSPTDVKENRRTLIVDNPNDRLQYFGFALNFSKPGESEPSLCYDPIGNNQNSSI